MRSGARRVSAAAGDVRLIRRSFAKRAAEFTVLRGGAGAGRVGALLF